MIIHTQRQGHDCGVAALASFIGTSYEDAYVAAIAASVRFSRKRDGLSIVAMRRMARGFGRALVRVNYRDVDLDEHIGILGVNWRKKDWKKRGGSGHWVVLRKGTIIDPSGPEYADAYDYLAKYKGRAGTLLREK